MMASYFGEVLEPSSRAIFEEFSDDEEEIKPIELSFCWFQSKAVVPTVLSSIYVYHGKLSVAFAEAYLLYENSSPIGEIRVAEKNEESEDDLTNHKSKLLPTKIYIENNVMTCLVSPTHFSDVAFQFVNCMATLLKSTKNVIVFTNEFCNNYRTACLNDLPPAFMRELKTSHSNSDYTVEKLPVPNIVSGVPAAIASWCQIYGKDASLFVCYTDQQKLDSVTALPYISVIKKLNPKLIKNANPDLTRKRFYGNPDIIGGSSNIYI